MYVCMYVCIRLTVRRENLALSSCSATYSDLGYMLFNFSFIFFMDKMR